MSYEMMAIPTIGNIEDVTFASEKRPGWMRPRIAPLPQNSWSRIRVGDAAPQVQGMDADGNVYDIRKSHLGKTLLLCYWSTRDDNYDEALRTVERLHERYGEQTDFQIVSFWMNHPEVYLAEMNRMGRDFVNRQRWWTLKYLDGSSNSAYVNRIDRALGQRKTPTFCLLDQEFRFAKLDVSLKTIEEVAFARHYRVAS